MNCSQDGWAATVVTGVNVHSILFVRPTAVSLNNMIKCRPKLLRSDADPGEHESATA